MLLVAVARAVPAAPSKNKSKSEVTITDIPTELIVEVWKSASGDTTPQVNITVNDKGIPVVATLNKVAKNWACVTLLFIFDVENKFFKIKLHEIECTRENAIIK